MFKQHFFLFLTFAILVSCGNHEELKSQVKNPEVSEEVVGQKPVELFPFGFDEIYTQIIQKDCESCHSDYRMYDNVKRDADRILIQITSNQMPQFGSPVSNELKELLAEWVGAGAPEFGSMEME